MNKIFKKIAPWVVLGLMLPGCRISFWGAHLDSWIGAPYEQLASNWQYNPLEMDKREIKRDDGSMLVIYDETVYAEIPPDMHFDSEQGWVEWSPASTGKFVCRTNIEVDSQGRVVSYYADGDCTTYNSAPRRRK